MITSDLVVLFGFSWCILGAYRLHKKTGDSCLLVLFVSMCFLRS